jgi:hypothetical protein
MTSGSSLPEGPDPGFDGCVFIQWLKKRGGTRSLRECFLKTRESGFDAETFIRNIGNEFIRSGLTRAGERVIRLMDLSWADQWMIRYDLEIPHHRHWKRLK